MWRVSSSIIEPKNPPVCEQTHGLGDWGPLSKCVQPLGGLVLDLSCFLPFNCINLISKMGIQIRCILHFTGVLGRSTETFKEKYYVKCSMLRSC